MAQSKFTPVGETGRSALVDRLAELFKDQPVTPRLVKGIGDDTAVFKDSESRFGLQTSETYVEGVDFDLSYTPLQHLGFRVVTTAISDILAMNGTAESILLSIGIPNKVSVEMLEQFYSGVKRACDTYQCCLAGGDITASPSVFIINITVNGTTNEYEITYRSGAQVNDAICVSGDLGAAYAGLRILLREKQIWQSDEESIFEPNLDEYEYVVRRQLVPQARTDLINIFHSQQITPSAMIDISKNTLQDLMQLLKASGKGALLYEAALPVAVETRAVADELQEDVIQYALQGGEDYELLFTLPEADVNKLVNHFADFVVIGKVQPKTEGLRMQTSEGDTMHFNLEK